MITIESLVKEFPVLPITADNCQLFRKMSTKRESTKTHWKRTSDRLKRATMRVLTVKCLHLIEELTQQAIQDKIVKMSLKKEA